MNTKPVQLGLFSGDEVLSVFEDGSIQERFERFHADNPFVYEALIKLSRQALMAGQRRIGMKMLWEVLRWNWLIQTRSQDAWKLNNNFTSRYVRLMVEHEPDLECLFEVRELRAD